ncbi:hypothetical protein IscW_ISCW004379 [Ixodes scapularis]|uniref:Uncharacterized protein n=1 Tax=Ixodes scapularis TaxID=6945 RepID=B7PIS1_IXOSC|nr:hypothetical protein IscW_ISCW004379 [Ixodes scapularis]|eukprot:XP_002406099.1 hypothetical protein IscW_ISCW004379 [Ixodes scapularis]
MLDFEPVDLEHEDELAEVDSEGALITQVTIHDADEPTHELPISLSSLQTLQKNDDTLKTSWERGQASTRGMVTEGGLLFYKEEANGVMSKQLVLPFEKRQRVLELGA